jgi:hypothetical protein
VVDATELPCLRCGGPVDRSTSVTVYASNVRRRKYCSDWCRSHAAQPDRVCRTCGNSIVRLSGRSKYCSDDCLRAAVNSRKRSPAAEPRVCEGPDCNNMTVIGQYGMPRRYCCGKCADRARRRRAGIPADGRHFLSLVDEVALTAVCLVCGPTVIRRRSPTSATPFVCELPFVTARDRLNKRRRDNHEMKPGQSRRSHTPGTKTQQEYRLRAKYGLSVADFNRMVADQNGRCAICETVPKQSQESPSGLVVDHNHETGAVRGLLCPSCNVGIGFLGDSPARLVSAAVYLGAFSAAGAA